MDASSALLGSATKAAPAPNIATCMPVRAAAPPSMEPNAVLERRKLKPFTPYNADAWEQALREANILSRFVKIPEGFRLGFILDFPIITIVQSPPNKDSVNEYHTEFNAIIQKEFQKERYIGPFLLTDLKLLIGPFQSSPLSIVPKPGKPGKFRLVQNFSFPHSFNPIYPNPSINSYINADHFPTTWGKFSIIYLLISRLPQGSEVATRDVAEAYQTIPLHPSQWPAGVVRISGTEACIDTCVAFGATPSAGVYGHVADAGAEIIRHRGMGPLDKWVDDHLFIRIRKTSLTDYNKQRAIWHKDLEARGMHQSGS